MRGDRRSRSTVFLRALRLLQVFVRRRPPQCFQSSKRVQRSGSRRGGGWNWVGVVSGLVDLARIMQPGLADVV